MSRTDYSFTVELSVIVPSYNRCESLSALRPWLPPPAGGRAF